MLISIIIPTYNVEDYLDECLESVFQQTYTNIEVIIVDNNSTDSSLIIAHNWKIKHPNTITVLQEKKQGAPAARNKGLQYATGKWIQFLDADDLLLPTKLALQVNLIKNINYSKELIVSAFKYQYLDSTTKKHFPNINAPIKGLFLSQFGTTSANLYLKSKLISLNGWDEQLTVSQESDIHFKLFASNKNFNFVLWDQSVNSIIRRRHSGQISFQNPLKNSLDIFHQRLRWSNFLQENHLPWYQENSLFIQDVLYHYITRVANLDYKQGLSLYKKYIPASYTPCHQQQTTISKRHQQLYRIFGFKYLYMIQTPLKNWYRKLRQLSQ